MEKIILSPNSELQAGSYIVTFDCALLPSQIAWLLDQITPALNVVSDIEGYSKQLTITKFDTTEVDTVTKLQCHFIVTGNSPAVPISVILITLLALLFVVAVFLTFDKIEQIIESPEGKAFGVGALLLIGLVIFFVIKNVK